MAKIRFLFALVLCLTLISSCKTDEENVTDDSQDSSVSIVNAFPNLSFTQPVDLQVPKDGTNRVFVVEKQGEIKVFDNNSSVNNTSTFLDLEGTISTTSEQGLLGLAFHPNYQSNGYFYVYYNPNSSVSYISRFSVSANSNSVDSNSELVILEIPQPVTNHNGGQLAFGTDGFLYIASGDGGGSGDPDNNSQTRSNLLGNILRIDIDSPSNGMNYSIPSSNPFVGEPNVRQEIFAYGLRNPWRMSFDSQTGDLWAADVGQNAKEEVNIINVGGNYGWKLFEGTSCFSGNCDNTGLIEPIYEYDHGEDRSITGGYVYRGANVSLLSGRYVFGDFVSGNIWSIDSDGNDLKKHASSDLRISSFGTDAQQELYVCDFSSGNIYKFIETEN